MGLCEHDLWHEFHRRGNEMIITRNGRCLFPLIRYCLMEEEEEAERSDCTVPVRLDRDKLYQPSLTIESLDYDERIVDRSQDHHRWKFRSGKWQRSRDVKIASNEIPSKYCSSALGVGEMLERGISFAKVKLTNRHREDASNSSHFSLASFHRYQPLLHLQEFPLLEGQESQTVRLADLSFVAVTHYQNEAITVLKKSYNPHAKGFLMTAASTSSSDGEEASQHKRTTATYSQSSSGVVPAMIHRNLEIEAGLVKRKLPNKNEAGKEKKPRKPRERILSIQIHSSPVSLDQADLEAGRLLEQLSSETKSDQGS